MPDSIFNFLRYHTLLESYFILNFPQHVETNNKGIARQPNFKNAFAEDLEKMHPFSIIDWNLEPFSKFRILVDAPPKTLIKTDNHFEFTNVITVSSWNDFIDSYRQLRNNITHGAKFLTQPLGNRDIELSNAGIEFIHFLNKKKLINMQEW